MLRPGSLLERSNPVTRVGASLIATIPLLASFDRVSATIAIALELVLLIAGGVTLRTCARRMWPLLCIAPLGALSMLLYGNPGGAIWWHWGLITISEQSAQLALAMALRVVAVGVPFVLLWLDIDPTDLADGMAQVVHLPARFVLGILASVRMVTLFRNDWRSLDQARRARGLGDTGAVRRYATMAFALLVFALRRASKLALAMEARGFGAGPRTWARASTVGKRDLVCLLAAALIPLIALVVAVRVGAFHTVLG